MIDKLNSTGSCYSIKVGNITVYYSYKTPVAFSKNGGAYIYGTEQKYSVTTSKHMSKYIGVNTRMPADEFNKTLLALTGIRV